MSLRLAVLLTLLCTAPARAQDTGVEDDVEDEPGYGASAVVEAPIPSTTEEDPTASGSEVPVEPGSGSAVRTSELFRRAPGTRVLSTGPVGSFTGVSLRGAELAHTSVLFDDLPVSGPDTGTLDLDLVPLAALDRVEVYRGGAPTWLGDGAVGGVVRLVPRQAHESDAGVTLGVGSFGLGALDGWTTVVRGPVGLVGAVGLLGAENDHAYLDDNGTRFDPTDDVERTRANADLLQGHGLVRASVDTEHGEVSALALGVSRIAGEPGPGSAPALRARRRLLRGLGAVGFARPRSGDADPWRWSVSAGGGWERNRVADLAGELGVGRRAADDRTVGAFARLAAGWVAYDWLELIGVATVRHDRRDPRDPLASTTEAPSSRWTPALALEPRVHGRVDATRWEIRPSVRLAFSAAAIAGSVPGGGFDQTGDVDELLPTARLGLALAPLSWLAVSASVATGRRAPSVLELFGDRGILSANPALEPESSIGGDVGAVARGRAGLVRGAAELRGFHLRIDDLIRWRRTAQFAAVAENTAAGTITGVEAGLRGALGRHARLSGALTWLSARDALSRRLPFRPPLVAHLRPELRTGPIGGVVDDVAARLDVTHTAASFVDAANLIELSARTHLGTGIRVDFLDRAFFVDAAFDDLADARGDDLLGYPLPGRRVLVRVGHRTVPD